MLIALIIIGALLRIYSINYSFWLDEIGQVNTAKMAFPEFFHTIIYHHLSPPIDYIITKYILNFGSSELILRLPSIIFGIISIYLFYLLSRQFVDKNISLYAVTLFAFSPLAIEYSQEVRMYSLYLLLSLASAIIFLKQIKTYSHCLFISITLINTLLMLTHYFGFIVLFIQGAAVLMSNFSIRKKVFIFIQTTILPISIFSLIWGKYFIMQLVRIHGNISYGLKPNLQYFQYLINAYSSNAELVSHHLNYLYLLLFVAGLLISFRLKTKPLLFLPFTILIVPILLFFLSKFFIIVTPRNLIILLPYWCLICAIGWNSCISYFIHPPVKSLPILIMLLSPAVYNYHFNGRPFYKPDWKTVAKYIESRKQPDEIIIVDSLEVRMNLSYYLGKYEKYSYLNNQWLNTNSSNDGLVILDSDTYENVLGGK